MSWLFSRALVEEYSRGTSLAGLPSAQLNVMPTQHKFLRLGKTMDASSLFRFGLTSKVLTANCGMELLMSFLVASRAKTYQRQEGEQALMGKNQVYGNIWPELLVRYDLGSSSWRTAPCSSSEGLPWSSVTLPKWGMTRSGALFQHPTLTRPISATAYGLWPTMTVHGNYNRKGLSKTSGDGLATAVKQWRTPNASDANKWSKQSLAERMAKGQQIRLNTQVSPDGSQAGQLNPEWVEWLMGWCIGWTDLKPLEMDKFQEWRQQHLICLKDN